MPLQSFGNFTFTSGVNLTKIGGLICKRCGKETERHSNHQLHCPDCKKAIACERTRLWRLAHLEQAKEQVKKWTREHPERIQEMHRKSRLAHPEPQWLKARRYRAWAKAHPNTIRYYESKRKAKRRGMPIRFTLNSWFPNSHLHHLETNIGIYIPNTLHDSVRHNLRTGKGMVQINEAAAGWLGSR